MYLINKINLEENNANKLSYGTKKTNTETNNTNLNYNNHQNPVYHLNTDNNSSNNDKKLSQEKTKSISNSKKNAIALHILKIEKLRDNEHHLTRNQIKENLVYNSEVYPNHTFNKSNSQSPIKKIKINEGNPLTKVNFLKINNLKKISDLNSYSDKVKIIDENKSILLIFYF